MTLDSTSQRRLKEYVKPCAIAISFLMAGSVISFLMAEDILYVMLKPLKDLFPPQQELIATSLTEGFFCSMGAAFLVGLFFASPFIIYQTLKIADRNLYTSNHKILMRVAIAIAVALNAGAVFGYYFIFPHHSLILLAAVSSNTFILPTLKDYFVVAVSLIRDFGVLGVVAFMPTIVTLYKNHRLQYAVMTLNIILCWMFAERIVIFIFKRVLL